VREEEKRKTMTLSSWLSTAKRYSAVVGCGGLRLWAAWWARLLGLLLGLLLGCVDQVSLIGHYLPFSFSVLFSVLYFMFSIPFVELKFEFNPTLQMFLYISIRS
jgi:ABC-type methionine transport system permease subunit